MQARLKSFLYSQQFFFKTTEQSKNNTKQKYIRSHMEREHKEQSLPQWYTAKEYCHIT